MHATGFVLSYQWSLPWWRQPKGWYQQVLGNWQVNGIVTAMTRHSVYRLRRERFFGAGLGAGNQRIFLQPAERGSRTESQRWSEDDQRMA